MDIIVLLEDVSRYKVKGDPKINVSASRASAISWNEDLKLENMLK